MILVTWIKTPPCWRGGDAVLPVFPGTKCGECESGRVETGRDHLSGPVSPSEPRGVHGSETDTLKETIKPSTVPRTDQCEGANGLQYVIKNCFSPNEPCYQRNAWMYS